MFLHEIYIEIKSQSNADDLVEEFNLLLGYYRGSGQTQGITESQCINEFKITAFPLTLEKESLNKKYNNFYVDKQIEKLEDLCNSKLVFKNIKNI
jgi:predicted  nucleic acid-binding Zn ribbon protein